MYITRFKLENVTCIKDLDYYVSSLEALAKLTLFEDLYEENNICKYCNLFTIDFVLNAK